MGGVFSRILFVGTPQNIAFVVVTKGVWYNALNCFCKFLRLVFVLVNTICKALDEVVPHFL